MSPPGLSAWLAEPPRMLRLLFLLLLLGSTAWAQDIEVRKHGSSWARIESDGTIRIDGSSVGKFESDGDVRMHGSLVGSVEEDGTIRRNGSRLGELERDGTLRLNGSTIGRIESDGTIRKNGSSWGQARPCPSFLALRKVAALLFFFGNSPDFLCP